MNDGRARTLEEVGKEFDVTRERIRQIEAKALRKLRHPSRSRNSAIIWTKSMGLSKRLGAVANMVSRGYRLADIGTDHAYIPIFLVEEGRVPSAVAMDINRGLWTEPEKISWNPDRRIKYRFGYRMVFRLWKKVRPTQRCSRGWAEV